MSFYSYSPSSVTKSAMTLGVSQVATPMRINSLDQRSVLNELFAVRYVCAEPEQASEVPYGYTYRYGYDGIDVYENDNPAAPRVLLRQRRDRKSPFRT